MPPNTAARVIHKRRPAIIRILFLYCLYCGELFNSVHAAVTRNTLMVLRFSPESVKALR